MVTLARLGSYIFPPIHSTDSVLRSITTHPLSHSLCQSLTHLLTHCLTHSLIHLLSHPLTHLLSHYVLILHFAITYTVIGTHKIFPHCPDAALQSLLQVEAVLAGGAWPPATDEAPHLCRRWAKLEGGRMVDTPL